MGDGPRVVAGDEAIVSNDVWIFLVLWNEPHIFEFSTKGVACILQMSRSLAFQRCNNVSEVDALTCQMLMYQSCALSRSERAERIFSAKGVVND